ncbi:MAG: PEP-CTERM sorting domain-containing protein [Phycisphaerales bacterium]
MNTRAALAGALVALALPAAAASADIVDVLDFNDLVHGEIVTTQYQASHGVTISADNFSRPFDLAVAFDSTRTGTRDDDLEDPWTNGNLAPNTNLGRMLILQENNTGIGDGIANYPDDEGNRPAGTLTFQWDRMLTGIGFDIIDLESPDVEMTSLKLYKEGSLVRSIDFASFLSGGEFGDPTVQYGNNSANRIGLLTAADLNIGGFDKAVFCLGGSMAIDNIRVVPTPGTITLAGLGGLCLTRRRRR